ncbi:MAG: nucleotidyltransferase family protein [Clostridia bacterium]|nr:nucleotidyltransferase family protein [Clostridia bacterium]
MRIAGIVAEYNPFHNGHAYHIEKTRERDGGCEATHIVAVMSGSFVQRGEPAVMTKFDRARAALSGGADLVLELPLSWALSSAEKFAFGAVSMLNALGCVDAISFGSEAGALAPLRRAVDTMETPRFQTLLKYFMESGIAFPEATQKALTEIAGDSCGKLLASPNNTLGIEYLKALRRLDSSIQPFTVARYQVAHDSEVPLGNIASATYLRGLLKSDRTVAAFPFMPSACISAVSDAAQKGALPALPERLERAVLAKLRTLSPAAIAALPGISEGLENRFYNAVRTAVDLTSLEEAVKTKRYPLTRVRRLIWNAFLGTPKLAPFTPVPYLRVLAANSRGKEILSAAKPTVPVIHRASQVDKLDDNVRALWELECRATDLHALAFPTPLPCGADHTTGIVRADSEFV